MKSKLTYRRSFDAFGASAGLEVNAYIDQGAIKVNLPPHASAQTFSDTLELVHQKLTCGDYYKCILNIAGMTAMTDELIHEFYDLCRAIQVLGIQVIVRNVKPSLAVCMMMCSFDWSDMTFLCQQAK